MKFKNMIWVIIWRSWRISRASKFPRGLTFTDRHGIDKMDYQRDSRDVPDRHTVSRKARRKPTTEQAFLTHGSPCGWVGAELASFQNQITDSHSGSCGGPFGQSAKEVSKRVPGPLGPGGPDNQQGVQNGVKYLKKTKLENKYIVFSIVF